MYHVVACIFFGLGKLNESQVSWIQTYGGAAQFLALGEPGCVVPSGYDQHSHGMDGP